MKNLFVSLLTFTITGTSFAECSLHLSGNELSKKMTSLLAEKYTITEGDADLYLRVQGMCNGPSCSFHVAVRNMSDGKVFSSATGKSITKAIKQLDSCLPKKQEVMNFTAAQYFCEGNIKTGAGSAQRVNITISNISNESIEMGLQDGSIVLENSTMFPTVGMFTYSAKLDEFGSNVKVSLKKNFDSGMRSMRMGRVQYSYENFYSNRSLKNSGSGWLNCR